MTNMLPPPATALVAPHGGMNQTWYDKLQKAFTGLASVTSGLGGLGTAAQRNVGIEESNLVEVLADGKLPELDGSNLTQMFRKGVEIVTAVTPGTGSQTAPSGVTYWNGSAAPATTDRHRMDDVSVSRAASDSGAKLRIQYQASMAIASVAGAPGYAVLGVALFRDAETTAIAWVNLDVPVIVTGGVVVCMPFAANAQFVITADDDQSHNYRVAVVAANTSGITANPGALSQRVLSVEEFLT